MIMSTEDEGRKNRFTRMNANGRSKSRVGKGPRYRSPEKKSKKNPLLNLRIQKEQKPSVAPNLDDSYDEIIEEMMEMNEQGDLVLEKSKTTKVVSPSKKMNGFVREDEEKPSLKHAETTQLPSTEIENNALELFEEKAEKFYVFGQLSKYLNLADLPEDVKGHQK